MSESGIQVNKWEYNDGLEFIGCNYV